MPSHPTGQIDLNRDARTSSVRAAALVGDGLQFHRPATGCTEQPQSRPPSFVSSAQTAGEGLGMVGGVSVTVDKRRPRTNNNKVSKRQYQRQKRAKRR